MILSFLDVLNLFAVVGEIMNLELFMVVEVRSGQSPYFHVSVEDAGDCVFVVTVVMCDAEGVIFFAEVWDLAFEGQFC